MNTLFVLAHQDDEFAFFPFIRRELNAGRQVRVVYLTDGGGGKATPVVRNAESLRALVKLGIPPESINFLGSELKIPDGKLHQNIGICLEQIEARLGNKPVERLFCLAWEGGHVDHDASHLVTLLLAQKHGILAETYECSLYNGYGTPWKLFRVMFLIPGKTEIIREKLNTSAAILWVSSVRFYRSQWKTWFGLLPLALPRIILRRMGECRQVNVRAVLGKPHAGRLLFEKMFGVSWADFDRETAHWRERLIN